MDIINALIINKRKDFLVRAVLLTLLGLVFLPIGFAVFNVFYVILGIFVLPYIINIDIFNWQTWYIFGGIFIAILIIDTLVHPEEQWVRVKFILASAFKKESGPVVGEALEWASLLGNLPLRKGIFGGMPYMTNMSNPINWANQIRRLANFVANLTLACPRKLKEALSYYLLYYRLNQDMFLRLNQLVNSLNRQGGECILNKAQYSLVNPQLIPLAIELNLVSVFKKINSEDYGIRIAMNKSKQINDD